MIRLINGDCITEMQKLIEDNVKVDLILTDPPYGTTACKWDTVIPFEDMWDCIYSLSKQTTPTLLFGTEPFSSNLRMSNIKKYRYDWIWYKKHGTGFLNAKKMPLKSYELISVFYKKLPKYNPQKKYVGVKNTLRNPKSDVINNVYGTFEKNLPYIDNGYRYPLDIIECDTANTEVFNGKKLRQHPTQKPVNLLEYLIKTYTDEGDLVLDFTMGSGSTGVACRNTNRDFIGIELDKEYFNIAKGRINNCQTKLI